MPPDLRQLYLERLRSTWRVLGEEDPLWAILSRPDKRGNRWNVEEFFKSGEAEIAAIEQYCANLHRPENRNVALDFGCGVGRLTRALSSRYANVIGVDISSSMIGRARELHADLTNARFVENVQPDLRFVDDTSVDFIYSVITLHHMPAALQQNYIGEFMRILSPRGFAVFQIASGYSNDLRGMAYRMIPNWLLAPLRRRVHAIDAAAEMHTLEESDVADIAKNAGRSVLLAVDVDSAGRGFRGRMLFVG
jgi:cyclopropane fatty-acyl-phospholipid synthase-like methyltransferase